MMDMGGVMLVIMIVIAVVMCGGMIFGAGWAMLRRLRPRRDHGAVTGEPVADA